MGDSVHNLGIFSFQGGVEGKRQVDRVIDKCASMQVELIYVAQFCCVIKNIVLLLFRKTCFHDHALQNLREAIATYRNSILRQADEMKREASLSLFVEYLERYYFLICFAVYIHTEKVTLQPMSPVNQTTFADWMKARPELYSILRRYIYS